MLDVDDLFHGGGPIGVLENFPDGRHAVVGQIDRGRAGPLLPKPLGQAGNGISQTGVYREAGFGQLDRRLENVLERQGAELHQRESPSAERRWNRGRQKAVAGDRIDAGLAKPFDRGRLADPSLPANGEHLSFFGGMDKNRHLAADAAVVGLQDVERESGSHRSIDGVAAPVEHPLPSASAQIVP